MRLPTVFRMSAIVIFLLPAGTWAQEPPGESCAANEAALLQHEDAQAMRRAAMDLTRCPQVGPPLIARRWLEPPANFGELGSTNARHLRRASVTVLDEGIFAAVLQLAADRSRPRAVRIEALTVAGHYADPSHLPVFIGEFRSDSLMWHHGGASTLRHVARDRRKGAQPVAGDPEERLLDVLKEVDARPDEDRYVLGAVRALLRLHYRIEGS